jgi:hypothetical protein
MLLLLFFFFTLVFYHARRFVNAAATWRHESLVSHQVIKPLPKIDHYGYWLPKMAIVSQKREWLVSFFGWFDNDDLLAPWSEAVLLSWTESLDLACPGGIYKPQRFLFDTITRLVNKTPSQCIEPPIGEGPLPFVVGQDVVSLPTNVEQLVIPTTNKRQQVRDHLQVNDWFWVNCNWHEQQPSMPRAGQLRNGKQK